MTENTTDDNKEAKKFFLAESKFIKSVSNYKDLYLEKELLEIAFAGRSNVGKSSLINALLNRKGLARVSVTPGRTQMLNFFSLNDKIYFVDLPGYGYAKVSKKMQISWSKLILDYLKGRPQLRRVYILIDARVGLKESDVRLFKILDVQAVSYQIVMTKVDKVKSDELLERCREIENIMSKHPAMHPSIIPTSAHDKIGIEMLQLEIISLSK